MIRMVAGVPGAGKSYFLAHYARKAVKRGRPVFSNFPIEGCYQVKREWFGELTFPPGCLIVVDEANAWFNSRKWQDLDHESMVFFAQHRHAMTDMILATQDPARVDVQLREIATEFIWLKGFGIPMFPQVEIDGEFQRVMVTRILVLNVESVPGYEHWGKPKKYLEEEVRDYARHWEIVRPWVFRYFDSWDKSQLDRNTVPRILWARPHAKAEDARWLIPAVNT